MCGMRLFAAVLLVFVAAGATAQEHEHANSEKLGEVTLKKEPRRFRSLYGAAHAAQLIGRSSTNHRYFRELLQVCANADKPGRRELQEARAALAK